MTAAGPPEEAWGGLVSRAQLALAVVDGPCRRPGETTTCAAYAVDTWVGG
jgi:hypothetical protein